MFFLSFSLRGGLAGTALALAAIASGTVRAQAPASADSAAAAPTRSVELRGGYTSGRFSHVGTDYRSSIGLFGGGGSNKGPAVTHQFDGLLLGADYAITQPQAGRPSTRTVRVGLDVLGARDQLRFANGRRATLDLLAVHPHFSLERQKRQWHTRLGVGLLAGRVGFYGQERGFDILSTAIDVDTVTVVPTVQFATGWNRWAQVEAGYGANGLLGLANPTYYFGVGTGFGPRSPLSVMVGYSSAASLTYDRPYGSYGYARLELAPATRPWRVSAFATAGTAQYQRVAVEMGYRLPVKPAPRAGR